ncbi:hypothetical protein AGE04_23195 [Salmonella enterica subsp. enterica serovar Kentucky]|nr:hypothetical protein AGE04_23195 [Salmonella enterica subsp. enterica serovar Kentucky]
MLGWEMLRWERNVIFLFNAGSGFRWMYCKHSEGQCSHGMTDRVTQFTLLVQISHTLKNRNSTMLLKGWCITISRCVVPFLKMES